ncbi:MAG TPA: alpha/beta hydrolase [Acidimicrobiales bacterium]
MTRTLRVQAPDGIGLHVLADDDGPARPRFLLVHGLASNARMWDGVRLELAARGCAVAAVDLRGHGQSDKPDVGYDFETISSDVVAVIDALGWERPFLAGQSWGGNVALDVAARRPERVGIVACVDGGWIDLSKIGPWEVVADKLAPPDFAGTAVSEAEAWVRRQFPDWPESGVQGMLANMEVRADGTISPWLSREHHMRILRSLWEDRPGERYPRVRVPALLVPCEPGDPDVDDKRGAIGEAERLLPVSRTQWFHADHDVHAQRPADVAELFVRAATEPGFFGE